MSLTSSLYCISGYNLVKWGARFNTITISVISISIAAGAELLKCIIKIASGVLQNPTVLPAPVSNSLGIAK